MNIGNHQQSQIDIQANPDALLIIPHSHLTVNITQKSISKMIIYIKQKLNINGLKVS